MNTRVRLIHYTALLMIISGCTGPNPYARFYHPIHSSDSDKGKYEEPPEHVAIYSYSSNKDNDLRAMLENGYEQLGWASFNGGVKAGSQKEISEHAEDIGASVVLVDSRYTNTVSGAIPFTVQNPSQMVVTNSSGSVDLYGSNGSGTGTYSGTSTTWVPGGTTTHYIPIRADRYGYFASF